MRFLPLQGRREPGRVVAVSFTRPDAALYEEYHSDQPWRHIAESSMRSPATRFGVALTAVTTTAWMPMGPGSCTWTFNQEDKGEELGQMVVDFIAATPASGG